MWGGCGGIILWSTMAIINKAQVLPLQMVVLEGPGFPLMNIDSPDYIRPQLLDFNTQ